MQARQHILQHRFSRRAAALQRGAAGRLLKRPRARKVRCGSVGRRLAAVSGSCSARRACKAPRRRPRPASARAPSRTLGREWAGSPPGPLSSAMKYMPGAADKDRYAPIACACALAPVPHPRRNDPQNRVRRPAHGHKADAARAPRLPLRPVEPSGSAPRHRPAWNRHRSRRRPICSASANAAADLPLAVGPAMRSASNFIGPPQHGGGGGRPFVLNGGSSAGARHLRRSWRWGGGPAQNPVSPDFCLHDLPVAKPDGALGRQRATASAGGRGRLDINLIAAEGRRKKLLVADMDSTIIAVECLDELADMAGLEVSDRRHHRAGDARRAGS